MSLPLCALRTHSSIPRSPFSIQRMPRRAEILPALIFYVENDLQYRDFSLRGDENVGALASGEVASPRPEIEPVPSRGIVLFLNLFCAC